MTRNHVALSLIALSVALSGAIGAAVVNAQSFPNQELWERIRANRATGSATPTPAAPAAATPTPGAPAAASGTIVDVAIGAGNFKTLARALEAAGLVETLKGKGPFTVFAPTDAAFAALPPGTLEELLKPENRQRLTRVLTYHVVPGEKLSTALTAGNVKTVEGSNIAIKVDSASRQVTVNDARVTSADIKASNGVIHVIDKVILPPN